MLLQERLWLNVNKKLDKLEFKETRMKKDKGAHKYLCYGIPAGLILGVVVAVVTSLNIGICAAIGMLLGVVIGTTVDYEIDRKKSDK